MCVLTRSLQTWKDKKFVSEPANCPAYKSADFLCWRPKCNSRPKCNKVLNVITFGCKCNKVLNVLTFGPKYNKVLNVISLQCNRFTPSVHCYYGGHPHWDFEVTAVAPKKPLTNIHVTLRARWYRSVSFYLLDISREAMAANRFTDLKLTSNDRWQNNEYADQFLSIYHWLRLLRTINFGKIRQHYTCVISDGLNKS